MEGLTAVPVNTPAESSPANQENAASTCPHCGVSLPLHLLSKARFTSEIECSECRALLRPIKSNKALKNSTILLTALGFGGGFIAVIAAIPKDFLRENLCCVGFAVPFIVVFAIIPIAISLSRPLARRATLPATGFSVVKRPPPRIETAEQKADREKREERKRYLESLVDSE